MGDAFWTVAPLRRYDLPTTVPVEGAFPRTLYMGPPVEDGPDREGIPEPCADRQPSRWRYHFPWVKTAVAAPTYNGELLLVNRTDRTWLLWHNYHSLGLIDPGQERHIRLVRVGTISARQLTANADAEYLLLSLGPDL